MTLPNLNRIVETHVPISDSELTGYLTQLRQDILPYIRKLQSDGSFRWYSFLMHPASQLEGCDPKDKSLVIHLRFEPSSSLEVNEFMQLLPKHFRAPKKVQLSGISGLDGTKLSENDWAHAWEVLGETSDWVLGLLEAHKEVPSLQQIVQFLHFITNSLGIGHKCICYPAGFLPF